MTTQQFNFLDQLDNPICFFEAIDRYAEEIFHNNRVKGFWDMALKPLPDGELDFDPNLRNFGEVISLILEELGESVTANRKDLMDDHLPQYHGRWAELADAVIRILDVCGAHGVPIGTIIKAKVEYNKGRAYRHGKKY